MHSTPGYKKGTAHNPLWQTLRAKINQDSTAARPVTGLDVIEDVAYKPARLQVELQITGSLQEHTRRRFAAVATPGKPWNDTVGMVRTIIYTLQLYIMRGELLRQVCMHALQILLSKIPSCDPRLIGDHHQL